jgi:hypothetical protein
MLRDISPCSPYVIQRFGGMYRLRLQGKNQPVKKPADSRYQGID